jgi:Glycoside hydrolase 131 catalytic N-terminal domain
MDKQSQTSTDDACRGASFFIGTPFNTKASGTSATTRTLRIRAHDGTVLFQTPFLKATWHNFAVIVDWSSLTLQVFYSQDADALKAVTTIQDNSSAGSGPQGQGDFHFGVLKVCLETFCITTLSLITPISFL